MHILAFPLQDVHVFLCTANTETHPHGERGTQYYMRGISLGGAHSGLTYNNNGLAFYIPAPNATCRRITKNKTKKKQKESGTKDKQKLTTRIS